jgi:hypothetical protein
MVHYKNSSFIIRLLIPIMLVTICSTYASAAQVHLEWSPSASFVDGYRVHWGISSRNYTFTDDVGLATNTYVYDLEEDTTYYFAVTAYLSDLESYYSNEVVARSGVPVTGGGNTSSGGCSMNPHAGFGFECFLLLFLIPLFWKRKRIRL